MQRETRDAAINKQRQLFEADVIPSSTVELNRSGARQNSSIFSLFKTGPPLRAVAAAFTTSVAQ